MSFLGSSPGYMPGGSAFGGYGGFGGGGFMSSGMMQHNSMYGGGMNPMNPGDPQLQQQ